MKEIIITVVHIIHRLLVYFMMFGFIIPHKYLFLHIITFPFVYLHWQLNNDKCILTELEYKLKGIDYKFVPKTSDDHDYPFMRKIFSDFGLNLTDQQIHKFIIKYLTGAWFISVLRVVI